MRKKSNKVLASAAMMTALSFASVTAANAAEDRHGYRTGESPSVSVYEFRFASQPALNEPLVVQLINSETGRPVSNAHVSVLRPAYVGIKSVPMIQNILVPLKPDGQGGYVYSGAPLERGERLMLRGHVPGESSTTWRTLEVVD